MLLQNPGSTPESPIDSVNDSFDPQSGNRLERIIFNGRMFILLLCFAISCLMAWQAANLRVQASFEKMIPQSHPYVRNYFDNAASLRGLGNSLRIVIANKSGDIYDWDYLRTLQQVNDRVFLMPGVDRAFMKSLWTPNVRWTQITEEGFAGGPVMPDKYDGSSAKEQSLRSNIAQAGLVGNLVATDQRSSMVFVPLLDRNAAGESLNYSELAKMLEEQVRSLSSDKVDVHIIGFAKLVGDLIEGLNRMAAYFGLAAAVAAALIFIYTRCIRSTVLVLACSIVAVVWQLGIVHLLGYTIDPYSILVPFLVFAIGVSHGAQKMNGIMQDVGRGLHKYVAARFTFRRLFLAGLTALLADAVGFAVLMLIDIPVIRDMALTASIGVAVLIFTNLILLPVLLSYVGVSLKAAKRSLTDELDDQTCNGSSRSLLSILELCTQPRPAAIIIGISILLGVGSFMISTKLKIGDLDAGAPELRSDSRYNRDSAFITKNFGLSSDQFAVIVKTPAGGVSTFETMLQMDRLEQRLRAVDGVQATISAGTMARLFTSGNNEGNPKWMTISRDTTVLNEAANIVATATPDLIDGDRSIGPVIAYLTDHKAETLKKVASAAEDFAFDFNGVDRKFLLAAGSAGIEAATNEVVEKANRRMMWMVFAAVALLCLITFRSWRAVLVAMLPLALTTVMCEALMVLLGIGVKVATLPVIALGVGIGVDYALYLLSVQLAAQRAGMSLPHAYRSALRFTGKVVALIGITLAAGVVSWAWSPIKFQADMGILLTFMFFFNMIGALVLIPALSRWLLFFPVNQSASMQESFAKQ